MSTSTSVSKPLRSVGEFFAMSWETLTLIPRRPFAWSEFLFQSWFVARVALLPTLLLTIPFTVLAVFTFNILLAEFGAADYSGVGAGEGGVTQIGPIVTALAIIGGSVAVVGFLTMMTGALVAVQGYNQLAATSVEALTGFASAFFNVRLISPLTAAIALAATIGAGSTAQLGAMRINEEIDALEVMGIRSVAYLASTRVLAGVIVVIPLYCVAMLMSFVAARFGTTYIYGQSEGVYDHYFNTFLIPTDLIWSFFQALSMSIVIMLVHTYYGYTASGGPAGVGEAVGRAVRTSLVISAVVILFVSLAIYGRTGNFHMSG
jgi:phospholipid/cholesterol/gamma-HCH transport system permease protein